MCVTLRFAHSALYSFRCSAGPSSIVSISSLCLPSPLFSFVSQTALGQIDQCETVCCSRGWNFYGEGNFSKLGVNNSSDCNCFDSVVNKCGAQRQRIELEEVDYAQAVKRLTVGQDDHCLTACCAVGHAYYGYGDYARLDTCNCVMQQPLPCTP